MIKNVLEKINTSKISDVAFNISNSEIKLSLNDNNTINFKDVDYFIYSDSEDYLYIDNNTPVIYDSAGIDIIYNMGEEGLSLHLPNFMLSYKDSTVLLEAKSVEAYGSTYNLQGR